LRAGSGFFLQEGEEGGLGGGVAGKFIVLGLCRALPRVRVIFEELGEMKNFELGPAVSVRLAERELNDEVGRYLNLVGSSRARDLRRMTISATGSGDREIFVSYISEVPVWKSTYRIIFPDKPGDKPLLQGWAIVDNTIGEDWKDVQLSLIAGAPQSFIQDISQPLYARRPVVALPQSAMLTPQTHEATVEESEVVAQNGPPALPPPQPPSGAYQNNVARPIRSDGNDLRPSAGLTMYEQMGMASKTDRLQQSAQLQSAQAGIQPEAEAAKIGDYFEYNLKQKITIGKNQSALVPILQSHIEAEKVTLWSTNGGEVPLRAIWIKNSSGQVLDAGTFNILEGGTFAGEGVLESIHPDERRLLSYAADTAVHVKHEEVSSDKPYSRVKIAKGLMVLTREQRATSKFEIRNADKDPRVVVLELPAENGWTLTKDTPKPEETTASLHRFRVPVEGGKTAELKVEAVHPEETQYALTNLDSNLVAVLVRQQQLTPALRQAFDKILAQRIKIGGFDQQMGLRRQETDRTASDQSRIRENMKALKGTSEEKALVQRYTGELNTQEDRLAAIRRELEDLQKSRDEAARELDRMVMTINIDESI